MSYYGSGKEEAYGLRKIEASFLKKQGYLEKGWRSGAMRWSRNGEPTGNISMQSHISEHEQYVRLIYTSTERSTGEKIECDYKAQLTTTACIFGGKRYWFICPLSRDGMYCGKRVSVLYGAGTYFGCRHCHNLTYNCRNLSGISKTAGQVISIPAMEKIESKISLKYYAGKMTRKYQQFIKKQDKSIFQLQIMSGLLYRKPRY